MHKHPWEKQNDIESGKDDANLALTSFKEQEQPPGACVNFKNQLRQLRTIATSTPSSSVPTMEDQLGMAYRTTHGQASLPTHEEDA